MTQFIFDTYSFDADTGEAVFRYYFDQGPSFTETIQFTIRRGFNAAALDRALSLAFLLIGTSYYKTFPTPNVRIIGQNIDAWQAEFLNKVYQEGLGQFAYENGLKRADLAQFVASGETRTAVPYDGKGIISLQSGGKDSLLVATLLNERAIDFSSLYISSGQQYPAVIDRIGQPVQMIRRHIDKEALRQATRGGGKNGHVPVTFIVMAIALVQAVLDDKNTILTAIGHEGEEPHVYIDDLAVTHQWSKTWSAEQLFAEYVMRYVSPNIQIGSPLRQYSELRIAELFTEKSWDTYGRYFSSCNVANYRQGVDNTELTWCGACPKCANSYLLFAPFLPVHELQAVFYGKDLFADGALIDTFKGLLGIGDAIKPFECIGEVDELRMAYQMARERGYMSLPFDVPPSAFDRNHEYPSQVIQL